MTPEQIAEFTADLENGATYSYLWPKHADCLRQLLLVTAQLAEAKKEEDCHAAAEDEHMTLLRTALGRRDIHHIGEGIRELVERLAEALKDGERLLGLAQKLFDQLEFCGWGDSYERECSEKLREQASDELEKQHAAAAAAEKEAGNE